MSETMKYITLDAPGAPEVLHLAVGPRPAPRPDEVLIRVAAAGVNRPDVQQRKGLYPPPPGASPILGLEVAGEVVGLGAEVTQWKIGDQLCALANGGGYAEYCAVPATQCLPWPAGFDAVQAAALPENFFTVWANMIDGGRLRRGESILVHGGSSGIGTTAIQLAHALGATVYATAGSDTKCAACEALGATAAINYKERDFAEEIKRLTEGRGVDVILDMVAAPYALRNLRSLAIGGRLVIIALQGGAKVDGFDLAPIMVRRLTVTGSTMRPRTSAQKGEIARALLEGAWPLLDAGTIKPQIYASFPLAEAARAHALMETSAHIGKIMLTV
jgi:NADPH2:quinone reductase